MIRVHHTLGEFHFTTHLRNMNDLPLLTNQDLETQECELMGSRYRPNIQRLIKHIRGHALAQKKVALLISNNNKLFDRMKTLLLCITKLWSLENPSFHSGYPVRIHSYYPAAKCSI